MSSTHANMLCRVFQTKIGGMVNMVVAQDCSQPTILRSTDKAGDDYAPGVCVSVKSV